MSRFYKIVTRREDRKADTVRVEPHATFGTCALKVLGGIHYREEVVSISEVLAIVQGSTRVEGDYLWGQDAASGLMIEIGRVIHCGNGYTAGMYAMEYDFVLWPKE